MKKLEFFLADESATVAMGNHLAQALLHHNKPLSQQAFVAYLNGDLGAGKTTLTRGVVRGLGHQGNVKSPTYTLVEPYELSPYRVYHFDLYRLADPEELEFMGIRDYFNGQCVCFIEWPEKGNGLLASADVIINMAYQDEQRVITLHARTELGESVLAKLANEKDS